MHALDVAFWWSMVLKKTYSNTYNVYIKNSQENEYIDYCNEVCRLNVVYWDRRLGYYSIVSNKNRQIIIVNTILTAMRACEDD